MRVHVITPSVPERADLRLECTRSVREQTVKVAGHLIEIDHARVGPARVRNSLMRAVPGDGWVAFLDDDDLWLPQHLEVLERAAISSGADVVYSLARVEGRPGWDPQQDSFDPIRLRKVNYIPLTGIVRAGLAREVGGFPTDNRRYEDWGFWLRLLDAGAEFHCEPEQTWVYRFGDWDSRSKEIWDGRR